MYPGHVFMTDEGGELILGAWVFLQSTRDETGRIEIIKDGKIERSVPFKGHSYNGGLKDVLKFQTSGWFIVRAICDNAKTFRFASTGPFYVEIGDQKRRISKSSAQFFLDWVNERAARVKLDDPQQREEVLEHHAMAKKFWEEMVAKANAE